MMSKSKKLSKEETYSIHYRLSSDHPKVDEWNLIHDFLYGYGYCNEAQGKYVRGCHVEKYLNLNLFEVVPCKQDWTPEFDDATTRALLEDLYNRLQEPLRLEAERIAALPKPKFDKVSIPNVNRPFPPI